MNYKQAEINCHKDADFTASALLFDRLAKQAGYLSGMGLETINELFLSTIILAYIKGSKAHRRFDDDEVESYIEQ